MVHAAGRGRVCLRRVFVEIDEGVDMYLRLLVGRGHPVKTLSFIRSFYCVRGSHAPSLPAKAESLKKKSSEFVRVVDEIRLFVSSGENTSYGFSFCCDDGVMLVSFLVCSCVRAPLV